MKAKDRLNSRVCRDIVWDEINQRGPLSAWEMYKEIHAVFPRTNFSIFASALMKQKSGLAVIEGVIDLVPSGLSPKPRHQVKRALERRKRSSHVR